MSDDQYQRESAMAKAAKNAVVRFVIQGTILFLTVTAMPLCGWIGGRIISSIDRISEKQDLTKDELNKINMSILRIQGDNMILNNRIEESNRNNNSRLDALSAWSRKNSDEIDKIKDWFLKPPTSK